MKWSAGLHTTQQTEPSEVTGDGDVKWQLNENSHNLIGY